MAKKRDIPRRFRDKTFTLRGAPVPLTMRPREPLPLSALTKGLSSKILPDAEITDDRTPDAAVNSAPIDIGGTFATRPPSLLSQAVSPRKGAPPVALPQAPALAPKAAQGEMAAEARAADTLNRKAIEDTQRMIRQGGPTGQGLPDVSGAAAQDVSGLDTSPPEGFVPTTGLNRMLSPITQHALQQGQDGSQEGVGNDAALAQIMRGYDALGAQAGVPAYRPSPSSALNFNALARAINLNPNIASGSSIQDQTGVDLNREMQALEAQRRTNYLTDMRRRQMELENRRALLGDKGKFALSARKEGRKGRATNIPLLSQIVKGLSDTNVQGLKAGNRKLDAHADSIATRLKDAANENEFNRDLKSTAVEYGFKTKDRLLDFLHKRGVISAKTKADLTKKGSQAKLDRFKTALKIREGREETEETARRGKVAIGVTQGKQKALTRGASQRATVAANLATRKTTEGIRGAEGKATAAIRQTTEQEKQKRKSSLQDFEQDTALTKQKGKLKEAQDLRALEAMTTEFKEEDKARERKHEIFSEQADIKEKADIGRHERQMEFSDKSLENSLKRIDKDFEDFSNRSEIKRTDAEHADRLKTDFLQKRLDLSKGLLERRYKLQGKKKDADYDLFLKELENKKKFYEEKGIHDMDMWREKHEGKLTLAKLKKDGALKDVSNKVKEALQKDVGKRYFKRVDDVTEKYAGARKKAIINTDLTTAMSGLKYHAKLGDVARAALASAVDEYTGGAEATEGYLDKTVEFFGRVSTKSMQALIGDPSMKRFIQAFRDQVGGTPEYQEKQFKSLQREMQSIDGKVKAYAAALRETFDVPGRTAYPDEVRIFGGLVLGTNSRAEAASKLATNLQVQGQNLGDFFRTMTSANQYLGVKGANAVMSGTLQTNRPLITEYFNEAVKAVNTLRRKDPKTGKVGFKHGVQDDAKNIIAHIAKARRAWNQLNRQEKISPKDYRSFANKWFTALPMYQTRSTAGRTPQSVGFQKIEYDKKGKPRIVPNRELNDRTGREWDNFNQTMDRFRKYRDKTKTQEDRQNEQNVRKQVLMQAIKKRQAGRARYGRR